MNLQPLSAWILNIEKEVQDRLYKKAQAIADSGVAILRGHVPIDTETLKNNIHSAVYYEHNEILIKVYVRDSMLHYSTTKNIQAIYLSMILEQGSGRAGARLKRTRANTFASAGSGTQKWWEDGANAWIIAANSMIRDI